MQLSKEFGFIFFWVIAAVAVLIQDCPGLSFTKNYQRAALLFGSALLGGFAAEALKLFIRRERPQTLLFSESVFREWSGEWWKSNDLSTPSSHAAVAFGAAWALCIIFPRPRVVWFAMAGLCGISRVVQQAHLPSDIYIAAVISYFICQYLAKKLGVSKADAAGEIKC